MNKAASKPTTEQLCTVINEIDSASQSAFGAIAALCRLALASLETSEGVQDIESLAQLFDVIRDKAIDTENYINAEAEGVVAITRTWRLAAGVRHDAKPVSLTVERLNHEYHPNNQPRARSPV